MLEYLIPFLGMGTVAIVGSFVVLCLKAIGDDDAKAVRDNERWARELREKRRLSAGAGRHLARR